MKEISPSEVEKRLRTWADVTLLSLELKRAALKNKYPDHSDDEINVMIRERRAPYGEASNER
jgi:hypothetical protein